MVFDDGVTLAGGLLQGLGVEDVDVSAGIPDQVGVLEVCRSDGDSGAAAAEHVCEELVRHFEVVAVSAVGADEEPAGEALLGAMLGITPGGLNGLNELGLDIVQGERLEGTAELELATRVGDGGGVAAAGDLGVDAVEAAPGAHQSGDADDGLVAEHADFNLGAVLEGGGHGGHSLFDEVEAVDGAPGVFDLVFELEAHGLEVEARDAFGREGAQDGVFVVRYRRGGCSKIVHRCALARWNVMLQSTV